MLGVGAKLKDSGPPGARLDTLVSSLEGLFFISQRALMCLICVKRLILFQTFIKHLQITGLCACLEI